MKQCLFVCLIFIYLNTFSQEKRLLSFDLQNRSVDTMEIVDFDRNITHDKTDFFIGINAGIEQLDMNAPSENVVENRSFTRKKRVSLDYNVNKFPLSCAVKLFIWENDSLKQVCSGTLISKRHVLTAAHCIAIRPDISDMPLPMLGCPAFDNGERSLDFGCSWVKKVHYFESWNYMNSDIAILELEQDIGNKAGWVSIGFNTDDHNFLEGIFYKFSYPGKEMEYAPGNNYNGDTLYYAYGLHTEISQDYFGMLTPGIGIPGESGSSLIKISNNEEYTALGTLVFSGYHHCRITDWKYYMIKSVMEKDFVARQNDEPIKDMFTLYPNPASGIVHISNAGFRVIKNLSLFNLHGEKILGVSGHSFSPVIDLSAYADGVYLLIIETEEGRYIKKVIKQG